MGNSFFGTDQRKNLRAGIEFDAEPSFVTAAVLVTTLLSPLTLTPLLAFLGA